MLITSGCWPLSPCVCIPSWGHAGVCPLSPLNDGNIKHSRRVVAPLSSFISKWSSWGPIPPHPPTSPAALPHSTHLSITAGLQLFASLWPRVNSLAYKLSVNSAEQGPFSPAPFVTVSLTNVVPLSPISLSCSLFLSLFLSLSLSLFRSQTHASSATFCSALSDGAPCFAF